MSEQTWTPEPWPDHATVEYVQNRVCLLLSKVWNRIDPNARTAHDCMCKQGGLWKSPSYAANPANFRNDGKALMWLESAAKALSGIPDPAEFVARAKSAIAERDAMREACKEVVRYYTELSGNPATPIPDKHWIKGALMARAALSKSGGAE